jgi:hypothetical protein
MPLKSEEEREVFSVSDQLITALPGAVLGFLGAIVSGFAAYYARNIRRESQLGLIGPRLQAYRQLWKQTKLAAPSRCLEDPTLKVTDAQNGVKQTLTATELAAIENGLWSWYYREGEGGNGIFLSNETGNHYRQAMKSVLNADPDDERSTREIVDKLSTLRSRTKNEIAVYGRWEE